jgi:hypothetical protein
MRGAFRMGKTVPGQQKPVVDARAGVTEHAAAQTSVCEPRQCEAPQPSGVWVEREMHPSFGNTRGWSGDRVTI